MTLPDGSFRVNRRSCGPPSDPARPLADFLRSDLGLTGTKVGCDGGDCGACTVLVDGSPAASCMLPTGQLAGVEVTTVEGLAGYSPRGPRLQESFLACQAVQCGFCIPGMLMTAGALLDRPDPVSRPEIEDALSGVLCRCTGYTKIVDAVSAVLGPDGQHAPDSVTDPGAGEAVGSRLRRFDGPAKVRGTAEFGADGFPADSLLARAVRSPFHRASFTFGDIDDFVARHDGVVRVFTAADIPGENVHGTAPAFADQPVLAEGLTRFLGEAVALVVGAAESITGLDLDDFPVDWTELEPLLGTEEALRPGAPLLHPTRPHNVLIRGRVQKGDVDAARARAAHVVEGEFRSDFVEHAYLEPEASWARVREDTVEVHSCTQAPYAHRADVARILGLPEERVRVVATAVGGGFGGKLDLTTQPFVALASYVLGRPVAMTYTREESIATSTKRHPAEIRASMGADAEGRLTFVEFEGVYNTGAYASWGSAVATRVPVSAAGPYLFDDYLATTVAVHTTVTPAGAFRGFGVPQTLVAQEQLVDQLAEEVGIDPLEFRRRAALRAGDRTATGQLLTDGVGMVECLDELRADWQRMRAGAAHHNATATGPLRRGVGVAAFLYGCGNTALPNPSTIRFGIRPDGTAVLHNGAVDAGQGAGTVIPQIAADALGVPVASLEVIQPDTARTPDCGRTSASRQTFVTGKAALLAGRELRRMVLKDHPVSEDASIELGSGVLRIQDDFHSIEVATSGLPVDELGYVFSAEQTFDPPTTPLDAEGQGSPYAAYAFGAQIAEVEVDIRTGLVRVLTVVAAHDVGAPVNPDLLEGQVEGAVAQGVGMALFERFEPGATANLHDYLIPSTLDVPTVRTRFVSAGAAIGPYGAKGIGEPAMVPTPAAILNAIAHATGARVRQVPATPEVVLRALDAAALDPCSTTTPRSRRTDEA